MDLLFELDRKDYDSSCTYEMVRKAARAIIIKKDKIFMVHSRLYDFYKFPGGGVKNGEELVDTLVREVKEETGLVAIPDSIKEYGYTIEKHRLDSLPDTKFVQYSYYYLVDVSDELESQNLDSYEADMEFEFEITTIEEALLKNQYYNNHGGELRYIEREEKMLELLKNNIK